MCLCKLIYVKSGTMVIPVCASESNCTAKMQLGGDEPSSLQAWTSERRVEH